MKTVEAEATASILAGYLGTGKERRGWVGGGDWTKGLGLGASSRRDEAT